MANKSRVILTENENSHRSRLIQAFKSLDNLEDYSKTPEGLWGCTATINIKCEYANSTEQVIDDITFKSVDLDFEFVIPFDDNLEANEGEIIIYNLSNATLAKLSTLVTERNKKLKKRKVTITAGHKGDTGVLYQGYITKIHTGKENADRVTTIKVVDDVEAKENLEESVSGKASDILIDLINRLVKKTNLSKGKITKKFPQDYTYSDSVTLDKSLEASIKEFSEVCAVSTMISKGAIYCCKLNEIDNTSVFNVSSDTGMIGSPQPFVEEVAVKNDTETTDDDTRTVKGFEIDMLLQHRMSTGAVINLSTMQYEGTYYVQSGEHRFNNSECVTHIKAIEVK